MHEFDKCEIENLANKIVATGYVLDFNAGIMKVHTREQAFLNRGQMVMIYILNSQTGECTYRAQVLQANENSIEFNNLAFLGSIQKRNNTRVSKQMRFTIHNKIVNGRAVQLEKPITINMLNISAQGMCFNCDEKLDSGFTFPLEFHETKRPVHLIVKIIRKEEYTRSNNYGCIFEINEKDMDELYKFVLKEQIEQRRKKIIY